MSAEILQALREVCDEIRGLREDMRKRTGLPDFKIGKAKVRDWSGPSMEGKCMSECPADFLLEYAGFLEWKSGKDATEGKKLRSQAAGCEYDDDAHPLIEKAEKVEQYAVAGERAAVLARRWATVNRGVIAAPEKPSFRKAEAAAEGAAAPPPAPGEAPPLTKTGAWGGNKSGWGKAPAA